MGKSEETRKYIIEKSAPVFNKYGYEGTSMSRLTKAINMTKGAIYGNFKDKNEIALKAFEYNISFVREKVGEIIKSDNNSCDKLISLAGFYLNNFFNVSKIGGCPILNAAVDSDFNNAELKERVTLEVDEWLKSIIKIVEDGIKIGEISKNSKPHQFASVFVSLIEGGMMVSKITGDTIHLGRNVEQIIDMVNNQLRV